MAYNLDQHTHNYAVWTAARAVQRGWKDAKTAKISAAISGSQIQQFADLLLITIVQDFDPLHKEYALRLIKSLKDQKLEDASYGRASKIIAIYLKTYVILRGNTPIENLKLIHPPIDKILLDNISTIRGLEGINLCRWTKLNKDGYWQIVEKIRNHFKEFNWTLEEYWIPEKDDPA
ncbi:MAG TPA: hypothetical protein VGN64_05790 [Dyadobacter sp.]|nr:hypothetical protein [Dyadobacter sp.]